MEVKAERFYRDNSGNIHGPIVEEPGRYPYFFAPATGYGWDKEGRFDPTRPRKGTRNDLDLAYEICIFKTPEGEAAYPILSDADGYLFEFAAQAGGAVNEDDDGDYTMFPNSGLAKMLKVLGAQKNWKERVQDIANDLSRINDDMAVMIKVFMDGKPFDNIHAIESTDLAGEKHTPKPITLAAGEKVKVDSEIRPIAPEGEFPTYQEFQKDLLADIAKSVGLPYHVLMGAPRYGHSGGVVGGLKGSEIPAILQRGRPLTSRSIAEWEAYLNRQDENELVSAEGRLAELERLLVAVQKVDSMPPLAARAIKRYVDCIVNLPSGGRLLGTFDKTTGKRFGYDKHEHPIRGSVWTTDSGDLYEVVDVRGEGMHKKGTVPTTRVLFKRYPADAGVVPFKMDVSKWALGMIYVHDPIPESARVTCFATYPVIPKRVFWDANAGTFVRVSASGKTEYPMSKEFNKVWHSERERFPLYEKSRVATMSFPALSPETVEALAKSMRPSDMTAKVIPIRGGRIEFFGRFKKPLDFDNRRNFSSVFVFDPSAKKPATIPLDVYYEPDRKEFWSIDGNRIAKQMSEAFNEKWRPRASEFKLVKVSRHPDRPNLARAETVPKIDAILKLIVAYLHAEDKQSKAVRNLLKDVRDLGLTI